MRNGPTKIILINAGKYDYAEVELQGAIQIVGRNNSGKTSLINTLQFLYIDDRSKATFGSYSLDQTVDYYFPGENSYVLFECRTLRGQVVIGWRGASRASGLEPERFFYHGPYRRVDFLDEQNNVRLPREITGRLTQNDLQPLPKAADHRNLLLTGNGLGIVALKDNEQFTQFRDTLKHLLNLNNITQDQMRDRLLMLAELSGEYVVLDSRRTQGQEYEQIKREKAELDLLKKHQPTIRALVQLFDDRHVLRAQLNGRWLDLQRRKERFDAEHQSGLADLHEKLQQAGDALSRGQAQLKVKRSEKEGILQRNALTEDSLAKLTAAKERFAGFSEDFEGIALAELESEVAKLTASLREAATETAESVNQLLENCEGRIAKLETSIRNFNQLAVTALRGEFADADLNNLFSVLNPDLLGLPMGRHGISLLDRDGVIARLRCLITGIADGVYQDEMMTVRFGAAKNVLAQFESVEALEQQLRREQKELSRLKGLLESVTQRDRTMNTLAELTKRKVAKGDELAAFRGFRDNLTREGAWLTAKAQDERLIGLAEDEIKRLDVAVETSREEQRTHDSARKKLIHEYQQVLERFGKCKRALFEAGVRADLDIPDDFDSAVALYRSEHGRETDMSNEFQLRSLELGAFGDNFKEQDERQTVLRLKEELEALENREMALQLRWTNHLHSLKGRFKEVVRDLEQVESAKDALNRQFGRVPVSDLKSVKLTIERQADEMSLIERLAQLEELGLSDDHTPIDRIMDRIRQKLERSSVIRITDLFTLGVVVVTADGKTKRYPDFRQIESDGTTITIKVLFNLLVLKSLLHKDDVAVPFFLDEIEKLDPANRKNVLKTAKQLGFIAITAAPNPVAEVDACYYLEPNKKGRVVLSETQRFDLTQKVPEGEHDPNGATSTS